MYLEAVMKGMKLGLIAILCLMVGVAQADIMITEIMNNPQIVADSYGEYIELFNTGVTDVEMNGWVFEDASSDTFLIDTLIVPAGEYVVLGMNDDMGMNGGVEIDYVYEGLILGNGADAIYIYDELGNLVDEVEYDGGIEFPDPNGASMYLTVGETENNVGANWATSLLAWPGSTGDYGSPGYENEIPPEYYDQLLNWSFQDWNGTSFENWVIESADLAAERTEDFAYHGLYSAMATLTSDVGFHALSQEFLVLNPGIQHRAEVAVLDGDGAAGVILHATIFDSHGIELQSLSSDESLNNPFQWQNLFIGFLMPIDAYTVRMDIELIAIQPTWDGDATLFLDAAGLAPILTIEEIQTNPVWVGKRVWTAGTVTQATGTAHLGYVDAYIQDETGYGIMLYDSNPNEIDLQRRDRLGIFAQVDQYFDVTELVEFVGKVVGANEPMPEPMLRQTGQFGASIDMEGIWCELTGELMTEPGSPATSFDLLINDGTGDATVRIWADAGLDLSGLTIGDNVRFQGTMDVYFGEAQLQPSVQNDVFEVFPYIDLEITPVLATIPANGGYIDFDIALQSYNPIPWNIVAWRTALGPNNVMYGPFTVNEVVLPANFSPNLDTRRQLVPANAPAGEYVFFQHIGDFLNNSYIFDFFVATKLAGGTDSTPLTTEDWDKESNDLIATDEVTEVVLPTKFGVGQAYPNPFNPSTALEVSLPHTAELNVAIYNVTGREVATVASDTYQAGNHTITIDGSSMASGVYFVHVLASGHRSEIRKIVLMK
jgi:Lamin Tail Domain/Secretion system C-terminal sorting domain